MSRDEIGEQYMVLKRLCDEGTVSPDIFMKCVIILAYEHAVRDELDDVRMLVNDCTEPYLNNILPEQMRDDAYFFRTALFVATKLSASLEGKTPITDEEMLLAFAQSGQA